MLQSHKLLVEARAAEIAKYVRSYGGLPNYRMGDRRMLDAVRELGALPCRGSYLDVSCGRGEMLAHAARLGFAPAQGTEVVPELVRAERVVYAEVHALPFEDASFDVVTLFDVIEHLIPGDDEAACRELARVARKHVLLTANNRPSVNPQTGDDLHINKRAYEDWDALFRGWFPGKVTWLGSEAYFSQAWRVDL